MHAYRINAPPPPQAQGSESAPASEGVLGAVPHQLRGFLAQFRNMPITGAAYDRCTGCSETVSALPDDDDDAVLRSGRRCCERMRKKASMCC